MSETKRIKIRYDSTFVFHYSLNVIGEKKEKKDAYILFAAPCRFAGYGRRLVQKVTGDSSGSWILSNINAVVYCDMNEFLDQAL